MNSPTVSKKTLRMMTQAFADLDYASLGPIYCDEGGEQFWEDQQKPCRIRGTGIGRVLLKRLSPNGSSLYVGAGVTEIPPLLIETRELERTVFPYNLREEEVLILNKTLAPLGIRLQFGTAESQTGPFDHLWIVSVLNDPETFPVVSSLAYGRADPITFDPQAFEQERDTILRLTHHCMSHLQRPGLVTTSIEEMGWITSWCEQHEIPFSISESTYPTALVGDPVCFIQVRP